MTLLIVILTAAVLLIGLSVLGLLLLLLAGIHGEERRMSLISAPPTHVGALSRRMLGVYVRRPRKAPRCQYQDTRR